MICVSISEQKQIGEAILAGADLLELRLDLIPHVPATLYKEIPDGIRTLVTCRPEGRSDSQRMALLGEAILLGASYVDLELESDQAFTRPLVETARAQGCEVIFSHHDFGGTPPAEELAGMLDRCYERGADVAKIATMVHTREDLLSLLSLYRLGGRKVVLGMGEAGRISRVQAPYLGSEFTFAAPGNGKETAPGQLDYHQLKEIYKLIDAS